MNRGIISLCIHFLITFHKTVFADLTNVSDEKFDAREHENYHLLPNLTECGTSWNETYRNRFSRSVNGWPAGLGKYLMVVRILAQNATTGVEYLHCSGTVINRRYILTAGHCSQIKRPGRFVSSIELGVYDTKKFYECNPMSGCATRIHRGVEEITSHEDFTETLDNDIALIRVDEDVLFDDFVKPVCLPYSESLLKNLEDQRDFAIGWGDTSPYWDPTTQMPSKLTEITVSIIPPDLCNTFGSGMRGKLPESKLCTIGVNGMDTCYGDSGGPLIRNIDVQLSNGQNMSRQFQIGIHSSATSPLGCGRQGVPSILTNVVKYMPWILNNLRP